MTEAQAEARMQPLQDALLEWIQPRRNVTSDEVLGKGAVMGTTQVLEEGEEN